MLFINRRTYSSYENGTRGIPVETISRLADIFNTSVDYLIGRTDIKTPYPKTK
jgi:transcriptional regulator with XRE-family HTH domain